MGKPGRPVDKKTTVLHKIFVENEKIIVNDNKIVEPKAEIWANLCKKLSCDFTMSQKAVYTAALKWLISYQKEKENEMLDESSHSSHNLSSTSSGASALSDIDSFTEQNHKIKFNIELTSKVWETIKPVTKVYSRKNEEKGNGERSREVLQPGVWTNVILEHIMKKREDIPCVWVFKTNHCHRDGDIFLKLKAKCKMCCSVLLGTLENEPDERKPVQIDFEIMSLDLSRHDNVEPEIVKIGGQYAKEVYGRNKPATVIRRSLLRQKASMFKRPFGRVPSANAIRCAKYRRRQKEKLSSCPLNALSYLKASTKYMNTIQFIGMDPFSCIYTSPNQVKLYKAYKKKNRFTKVSCDASANVANELERPGGEKSGQIFFYAMVISDGFQAPVHNMLSELNDTNWITFYLSSWVKRTSEIPNQFTSDMSMALLNGAVKSFTSCGGVAEYIGVMFDLLQGNTHNNQMPKCFIRIDIAHLMKNVTSCVPLQNKPKKMRDFFIRCVAWLLTIDNIDQAKEHIFSVLVVATSLTEGISTSLSDAVPCEAHKKALIRKITGDPNVEEAEKAADLVETSVFKDSFDETMHGTNVSLWLERIRTDATVTVSSHDDGDRDNLMYNTEFVSYFMDLLRLLPLWSAICCQFFPGSEPIASSGNVESHINVVKRSLEDIIPCSVDKFVQEHMDMVEGLIIEASQNYIKFIKNADRMEFDFSTEHILNTELKETPNTQQVELQPSENFDPSSTIESIVTKKNFHEEQDNTTYLADTEENLDVASEIISDVEIISCPVCNDKNWPSGAHKCIVCGKKVHVIPGCSIPIGGDEGHGEKRVCVSCDIEQKKRDENKIAEMNHCEKWSRRSKRQIKQSKYRMAVPNWNLNHHFDKNVNIGFLSNGNMSLRVFGTKDNLFGLKNTSSFDVLAQILAAVYAYLPTSRNYMDSANEGIFEIAVALAKNDNMNRVNNMRARLLSKLDSVEDMDEMMKLMLKNMPSCIFTWKCDACKHSKSLDFHHLQVGIRDNISKLNDVVGATLKNVTSCKHYCPACGDQIMVFSEFVVNEHLFLTLRQNEVCLAEMPDVIRIREEDLILFGGILFYHPLIEGDDGHYVAAIKVNATWNIFDDKKSKPYYMASKKVVSVHTLLYTKRSETASKKSDKTLQIRNAGASSLKRNTQSSKENDASCTKGRKRDNDIGSSSSLQQTCSANAKPTSIEQIGLLTNGCSYKVGRSKVIIKNTCGFDSIAHVLAAAFLVFETYRKTFESSEDEIFRLASSLANNDSKKKINNMRSELILSLFGKTDNACVVNLILSNALKHAHSVRETLICTRECCMWTNVTLRPFLSLAMNVFGNDMNNLEISIAANLSIWSKCRICEQDLCVRVTREFGHHLFIEMPISSLDTHGVYNEEIVTYTLKQLKLSIEIDNRRYSLFGLILFQVPQIREAIGHYVTAVKVNETYLVLDQLRRNTYRLEEDDQFVVHFLFYIEDSSIGKSSDTDSSFEMSIDYHSYESFYKLYHQTEYTNIRM